MKIALVLSVVFLDYVLTAFQNDAINNAETSDIKRLTEQVGSYECKEGGCLVKDEMLIPNNPVILYKRDAKHIKQKHVRRQIRQNRKKAKLIQKHIRNVVNEIKKDTIKSAKARRFKLYNMMTNTFSTLGKMSRVELNNYNKHLKPTEFKNMTVTTTQHTLNLVNTTVDNLETLLKEYANNVNELIITCINELKNFSLESNLKAKEAVDSGDKTGAIEILKDTKKRLEKMTKTITKKIEEYHASAKEELKDFADYGGDLVKKAAETQVKQMEGVKLKTGGTKKYVSSASKKIKSFSNETADMFKEMVEKTIQLNNDKYKSIEKTLNKIPICQLPNCKLEGTTIDANKKEEKDYQAEWDKVIDSFLDESKQVDYYQTKLVQDINRPINGNDLIKSLENMKVE